MYSDNSHYIAANKANWNDRVRVHIQKNDTYDIEGFKKGKLSFVANEHEELGDVRGKSLLHLQCHFGLDTMSWTRLGARAVGLDFSEEAIKVAEQLRDELGMDTRFVCANVYDADKVLDEQFDIVFVSVGAIVWLPDLMKWGRIVSKLLKPGGLLYLKDSHPLADICEWDDEKGLYPAYPYSFGEPLEFDESFTYTSNTKEGDIQNTKNYQWIHSFASIINAISSAGLCISALKEHHELFFRRFPVMTRNQRGQWELPEPWHDKVPLSFTLFAQKSTIA